MLNRISRAFEVPARAWCKAMHPDPMWPVGGFYRCPECLRQYPVQWESQPKPAMADVRINALQPQLLSLRKNMLSVTAEPSAIKVLTATSVG